MKFPTKYPFLINNEFSYGEYAIVPIRYQDRLDIMKWRNEQMYHLRQSELLTEEKQNDYYKEVVSKLFKQQQPQQILFSYLKNGKCIGYGGLVHINWIDKYAEISFIMDTALEKNEFELHWTTYLQLIEKVAFSELNLHKIFTYAFDLRPHLYQAIEKAGFVKEAVLKEHCFFNHEFKDVIIHCKYQNSVSIRAINLQDLEFTYLLSNDPVIRKNSYNSEPILYANHKKWFADKVKNNNAFYYIGEYHRQSVAFLRIDMMQNENVIGIAIDKNFRGKGLAVPLLQLISKKFVQQTNQKITAYIKEENIASMKSFEKAGYIFSEKCMINNEKSVKYIYEK